MTAPRTAVIRLVGGGRMLIPDPDWCTADHHAEHDQYPADVAHTGPEQQVTVTTNRGEAVLLAAELDAAPYSALTGPEPCATVMIDGDWYRFDPAGLRTLADQIADRTRLVLGDLADQLAAILQQPEADR